MSSDAVEIMLDVINENIPEDMWSGSQLAIFKHLAGTNKGEIGEAFIERYLTEYEMVSNRAVNRVHPWDLEIAGEKFEVKTASLGRNGTFQFNHIRLDQDYRYLICLGVRPDDIMAEFWRKGDVAEGKAGKLVRMAEGQSITFKLTLRPDDLQPVECLPENLRIEFGF